MLRRDRRSPGDERAAAVSLSDRGFAVLIPDQRPAEHCAPEDSDISRAVAGDRSESAASGEELVGRLDQTELVAVGIGENDVPVVGTLADIDVASAEPEQAFDRLGLVVERSG